MSRLYSYSHCSPGGEIAEVFRNRKGYFSLNVQAAVGPRMEILDIVVQHPGSTHDSVIFYRSALRVRFEQQVNGLLLGDNGYPCRPYLLTPVIHPNNNRERRCNLAHKRTRNIVERVFGVWKRRFGCLHRGISTKLNTALAVICACAVLHNISVQQNDIENEGFENEDVVNLVHVNDNNNQLGLLFRANFTNVHF